MSGTNNLGKMPILIVSLVIGIVMATTAIVPLVSDYSEAHTLTNEGYYRADKILSTDTEEYTISWVSTSPNVVTVNNESISIDLEDSPSQLTIVFNDDWMIRATVSNEKITAMNYIRSTTSGGSTASSSLEIVLNSGTMTITSDGVAGTGATYLTAYIPAVDGNYTMKKLNSVAYVFDDSELIAFGLSTLNTYAGGTYQVGVKFNGTPESVTPETWRGNVTLTYTDVVIDYSESSSFIDVLELSKITFNANLTESENVTTTGLTYSYFLVPYEITADPDNPAAYKALVKVVPMMAFVALIAAAAYMIYSKRD